MADIYRFLDDHEIAYQRTDHPAVYTVEEADRLVPPLPGRKTKNLFIRDAKGRRHFLVVVPAETQVDLKGLKAVLGTTKLGFASADRLMRYLGVEPGAVTLLGLVNDADRAVEVVVDRRLWEAGAIQSHPLVNTATLVLPGESVRRFLNATGHDVRVERVPERS
jgi:Ala-tRNA(Pro) deacylase